MALNQQPKQGEIMNEHEYTTKTTGYAIQYDGGNSWEIQKWTKKHGEEAYFSEHPQPNFMWGGYSLEVSDWIVFYKPFGMQVMTNDKFREYFQMAVHCLNEDCEVCKNKDVFSPFTDSRGVKYYLDGNKICAVKEADFIDLQVSPAGFGNTESEALVELVKSCFTHWQSDLKKLGEV